MLIDNPILDYELGRLYASMGEYAKAADQYELVLNGKCTELNPRRSKGKVSLQVSRFLLEFGSN